MKEERTTTAEHTERLGRELASETEPGDLILLEGDLAAGKTTFVRGLVEGLGGDPVDVSSPTFVLIQSYRCEGPVTQVHHVDLYRLEDRIADLRELGLEEMLSEPDVVMAVEWPKNTVVAWLPTDGRLIRVTISIEEDGGRHVTWFFPE